MNGIFRFGLMCATMIGVLLPLPSLAAQTDYLLKLDPIKGESEVKGEGKGWIEIQGWDWGGNNPASVCRAASGGQGAGGVQPFPLVAKKRIDKITPLLHKALVQNQTIESALLLIRQANGRYLRYEFKDVLISGISPVGGVIGAAGSESLTIKFMRCELK